MSYVYILKSQVAEKFYYGYSHNLQKRLLEHNSGKNLHTAKYKPWEVVWYAAFSDDKRARDFEKYLKTASGKAFARKGFIPAQ